MRWGIVATVSEPAPLLLSFVAHHLDLGAAEVTLYLDTPAPEVARLVDALPGCRTVTREPSYWRRAGYHGPPIPPERQRHNARAAYAESGVDWLLHIDADEFLVRLPAVLKKLATAPAEVDFVRLRPLERVWIEGEPDAGIFDGAFRRRAEPEQAGLLAQVHGEWNRYLAHGIGGNARSKSFCRTGRPLRMGVHAPDEDGSPARGATLRPEALLHFDGATRAHLVGKLRRKMGQNAGWRAFPSAARRAQMEAIALHGHDPRWLAEFGTRLQTLDAAQARALSEAGLLLRVPFDPAPALARWFPGVAVDLSAAHFDTLRLDALREPAILAAIRRGKQLGRKLGLGRRS